MSPSRRLARFASSLGLLLSTAIASGQTPDCAVPQGNTRSLLPQHSANLIYVAASNDSRFLYGMTQFGWVRAPLADPRNPAPLLLGQHGLKFQNGGRVPMVCDCWQMGTTMAFAEAPDGSARVFFDNNASGQGGGLPGQVGRASGTGPPEFGQQIDMPSYASGVGIAAVYLPASGKFVGYLPGDTVVHVVDGSSANGDPLPSSALRPFGTLNWGGFVRLKAARIQVPSLAYDKHLLVGGLGIARQVRIAEIDASTGLAVEKASVASVSEVNTIDIATVGSRIFVFSAEGTSGLQIYEYTPSQFGGSLTRVSSIPGDVNPAVVRGGQFPAIFMHRQATAYQSFIDVYDTKFLTQGGQPRKAFSLPHGGAPQESGTTPAFLGRTMDAVVRSSGGIVTAYVYRVVQKRTGENEDTVRADRLDISCIAADLTTPPVASSSLVNVSAQTRSGVEATRNYFGDRWQIRDTSASGAPLDQIEWDFNVVSGQFLPNESAVLPGAASEVNPAYFPCDPSSGGNIRTGANCHLSLGSPASGNFSIGNRTHNANGWSPNTFISAPQNVITPDANVAGFDGTTLRVLSGGQASAAGSQGNIAEASVAWAFNPGSIGLNGLSVTVPTAATSFWVDVVYKGGYMSRRIGNVQQVDLVPDFTLAPNPVLNNGTLTLTNTMQIGGATTLNAVTYAISPGGLSGSLPASFRTTNGTGPVAAPGTTGAYTLTLTYSFSGPQGANQNLTIAKNFSTTTFAPNPVIGIYSDQNRSQGVFCQAGGCYVDSGRTYYFFDEETIPVGISHPGTQWTYVSPSGEAPMGTTPAGSAGPLAYTFGAACSTGCSVRVAVGGVTKTVGVVVSSAAPPPPPPPPPPTPPPPPPPGGLSVALTGPSSGSAGTPISFTAIATGGSGTVSYAWRWGDNALSLNYSPGPATNSYTYPGPGQFTVAVRATDSGGAQANASFNVTIGAPSGPPLAVTVSGPSRGRKDQALSFATVVSGGVPPYSYAWRWGDSSFGSYVSGPAANAHAYGALGTFTVSVRVTDSAGVATTATTAVLIDEAFQALLVPGAAWLKVGDDTWGTDVSVANPGNEPVSLAVAFLAYSDQSAATVDLSQLTYRTIPTPLAANGGSWSQTNIVQWLGGRDTDKGTVVLRYEGPTPVVNGRVYFAKSANPLGPAYGAPIESFKADSSGRVLAQGGTSTQGIEVGGDQTLIGLRSTDLYRFGLTLYNSSGVETRAELRAFDETGAAINIIMDDAGNRGPVREVRIRPYQQVYLRNQDLGLPQDPNRRYVFRASKVSSEGSLVAFGAAIDTKTSDLEQFTDDTPTAISDDQGSVYLYIPGASRFNSGNGAKWRTELRAYNPANVERTLVVEYLYVDGVGQAEKAASATLRVGPGKLIAADDVIGSVMDEFTPDDLKTLSTTGLLRLSYFPGITGSPMIFGARNYDDQVAGTAGTQLAVYSRGDGVSAAERPLFVPGAQEDAGERARLRTTVGVFAMDNRQTRVRVSVVRPDGTVPANGAFDFVLNQTCASPPCGSGHMAQIFMDRNSIPGLDFNQPLTIKTEVLDGGRAGVYVVTVDTSTRDTSFKAGRPVR